MFFPKSIPIVFFVLFVLFVCFVRFVLKDLFHRHKSHRDRLAAADDAVALVDDDDLLPVGADRRNEPAWIGELIDQRLGQFGR